MINLPPLGDRLLKRKYTESDIEKLEKEGKVTRLPYRVELATVYSRGSVLVRERVSLDPRTLLPWFACKLFYTEDEEMRRKLYEAVEVNSAIEKMKKEAGGIIFGNSSESDPFVSLNALATHDRKITEDVVKYFREIEAIINIKEQMLKMG